MLEGQGYLPVSDVINSQLVPVYPAYSIYPAAFGPGPVMHDFYSAQPTTPPYAGAVAGASAVGGTTDTANNTAAGVAAANPYHPRYSPLIWSVAFLVIGLLGLRLVHWGP